MDELSGEELAVRSGVTAEQLRRLVELGVITPTPQGRFRPSDIQRIRVVDTLAEAGFAPKQLSELIATGAYDLDWASMVFPEPTAQLTPHWSRRRPPPGCRRTWPHAASTSGSCRGPSMTRRSGPTTSTRSPRP